MVDNQCSSTSYPIFIRRPICWFFDAVSKLSVDSVRYTSDNFSIALIHNSTDSSRIKALRNVSDYRNKAVIDKHISYYIKAIICVGMHDVFG